MNEYLSALGLDGAAASPAQPSRLQRVSSRGANALSSVLRPTLAPNGVQLSNLQVTDNLEVRIVTISFPIEACGCGGCPPGN